MIVLSGRDYGETTAVEEFFEWVWGRHHNILSWYVRPLFLLPYCYFAYTRRPRYLFVTLLLFPTSLFWFPEPAVVSDQVMRYMALEREFLFNSSVLHRLLMALAVVGFLWVLALAFWKRSVLYGLLVLNAGTCLKIIWSVFYGGDVGYAAIVPSVVTLLICNTAVYFFWRRARRGS